jgi:hypothetical protein
MIALLVYLVVICLIVGLVYYIADNIPIPSPLNNVVKVVAMVIGVLVIVLLLLQLVGIGPGVSLKL